jgi:hypothetical protein
MSIKLTRRALLLGLLCAPLAAQAKVTTSPARKRLKGRAAERARKSRKLIVYTTRSSQRAPRYREVSVNYSGVVHVLDEVKGEARRLGVITDAEVNALRELLMRCEEGRLTDSLGMEGRETSYIGILFGGHGDVDQVELETTGEHHRTHSSPHAATLIARFDKLVADVSQGSIKLGSGEQPPESPWISF